MAEPKLLRNIRVIDFSWFIAGPLTIRTFSNFGAEVIKVESANRLDAMRTSPAMPKEGRNVDHSGVFNDCNTGKLSVTLDLNKPGAIETALKLVKVSDVVISNFAGDRMERWGLGYEDLVAVRPDIIVMKMSTMGEIGPHQHYASYGTGIIAAAGLHSNTGFPDRVPIGLGPAYSDFTAPHHAVTVLLAALYYRRRTGRGQFIDFGQYQSTVSLMGPAVLEYMANGTVAQRIGNHSPDACPHSVYRCLGDDKWCAIAIETEDQWRRLCQAIGRPELAEDPRFATLPLRKGHEDEIDALVEAWTSQRRDYDVMECLQAAGVPAGVTQTIQDMLDSDPHLRARHFADVPHPDGPVFTTHKDPIKFVGKPQVVQRGPNLGEHNDYVLRTLLGLSDDEVAQLVVEGVIY